MSGACDFRTIARIVQEGTMAVNKRLTTAVGVLANLYLNCIAETYRSFPVAVGCPIVSS